MQKYPLKIVNSDRTMTPSKRTKINKSVTEKILKQIKSPHTGFADLLVQDTEFGKIVEETKKRKTTCEMCLVKDTKLLPFFEIQNASSLCSNHAVKEYLNMCNNLTNRISTYRSSQSPASRMKNSSLSASLNRIKNLQFHLIEPISIKGEKVWNDKMRQDNINLIEKINEIKNQQVEILPSLRDLLQQTNTFLREIDKILRSCLLGKASAMEILTSRKTVQDLIPIVQSFIIDSFFEKDTQFIDLVEDKKISLLKEQEQLIQQLRKKNDHQDSLIQKIQSSNNKDNGLLDQVLELKRRVEDEDEILKQISIQSEIQQKQLKHFNVVDLKNNIYIYKGLFDKILKIVQQYPKIFSTSHQQNILQIRWFQYDIEKANGQFEEFKEPQILLEQISTLNTVTDELKKANSTIETLQQRLVNLEKGLNPTQIDTVYSDDPILNKMIRELSLIILSKDSSQVLSPQTKYLMQDIFQKNYADLVDNYEKQIQALRLQVQRQSLTTPLRNSILPQTSIYGFTESEMSANQKENEFMKLLAAQAQTIERLVTSDIKKNK